ncbi:AMP-binding protein, partial [Aquimarina litoralis]|uniref:AMP-binding protein n=1 Tax=Aquimarina litoralis TaxID=584605 RepID=UPI0031DB83A1
MDKKVIHTVFEESVNTYGSHTSIEYGDFSLSYTSLNSYSNQLSHAMLAYGLSLEDICGVFMDDDLLQIISLIGAFKSGGVYVPIDTKYKENHWSELYTNLQPKILLTTRGNLDTIFHYNDLYDYTVPTVLVVDIDASGVLGFSVYESINDLYEYSLIDKTFADTN